MIETAEQFSRNEILTRQEAIDKQEPGLMPSLIRQAGELGFCGIDTGDAYGGLGLGKNVAARILEFLSLNGSFSVTVGITSGISQVGVSLFGTEEQKLKYLPPLTSGEQIGAYCLSEPNSGSDALSMSTRADQKDGKWILNGTKMWISNAQWADQFLVMAKVGGEKVTAFIVERGHPGVTIEREEHKMGLKGSSTARVTLDNAEIPLENMLWDEGKGHYIAFNALNLGRFKLASMSLGPAREALYCASAYASDRKQFGRSISQFELIQKKLTDMAARYFAAESMTYRTGALIDGAFEAREGFGLSEIEANRKAAEEFAVECSACKVIATEAEAFIVDEAVQIYGGYGFTEEFPVARIYRDARVSRIYEGTNEINRIFLADRFMRRAKEGKASLTVAVDSFASELTGRALKFAEGRPLSQTQIAGLSDLMMLSYAEQSARIRASRFGKYEMFYGAFCNWANIQALAAYQMVTGESAMVPTPIKVEYAAAVAAVTAANGVV